MLAAIVMEEYLQADSEKTYATIIAIEDYRFSDKSIGINPVKFARNDATKFKKLLNEEFNIPDENITIWLDKEATKSALENELKYQVKQLTEDSRFIFYYAGHGFYQNSHNKITCWDTHPDNLDGTSVSLKDVLIDPLENSLCEQSLIFIDSCSTYLKEKTPDRDIISNLSIKEFDQFVKTKKYHGIFMSCSPGEKSYPSKTLRHGIWTWHLIEALKGNIEDAIVKDKYITDNSLKNYLSIAVPKYITEKTIHKTTQKPFTKIHSTNDFLIRELPAKSEPVSVDLPKIKLKYNEAMLRKITFPQVSDASGFAKGHFIPSKVNASSNSFIQQVFDADVKDEIQNVYEKTKQILGLRKKDIKTESERGSGSVECEYYRYFIDIEQHDKFPFKAKVTRRLVIRVDRSSLPKNFDDIFPRQISEIVIPIEGELDFDLMVEKFENFEEVDGGSLTDNEQKGLIEYQTSSGLLIKINFNDNELIVSPNRDMKCLELIDNTIEGLTKISLDTVKLLGQ